MDGLAVYWNPNPSSLQRESEGPAKIMASLRDALDGRATSADILHPLSCEGRISINKKTKVEGVTPPQLDVALTFPHCSLRLGTDQYVQPL